MRRCRSFAVSTNGQQHAGLHHVAFELKRNASVLQCVLGVADASCVPIFSSVWNHGASESAGVSMLWHN
jgi:hypothetical protein